MSDTPDQPNVTSLHHGRVAAVHRSPTHTFSKITATAIVLLEGQGVEGDAHAGRTVQHRSRVARDPSQPNLRQVHLIQSEVLEALGGRGLDVAPGEIGENITTRGIDLLGLPTGTDLHIGNEVVVRVTGLRNPCVQLDTFRTGLLAALLERDAGGELLRKAGVMAVVVRGGRVAPGDPVRAVLPPTPHEPLRVV